MPSAHCLITCIDDDLTVLLALGHDDVELLGITVTYGNADSVDTVCNAFTLRRLMQQPSLPVLGGAGWNTTDLKTPTEASTFLAQTVLAHGNGAEGSLFLVAVGAMTNLATAMTLNPEMGEMC